jgi:hypothetical protein
VNGQAFGGGILLAVGAALWAVYFLPIWTKRRQFSAAQENALRIQRTLRMLAETTDVPREVHVEATAKQVLAHERLLQASERSLRAEEQAKIAAVRLAEKQAILEARAAKRQAEAVKRELLRRSRTIKILRAIAAIMGMLSLFGLVAGIALAILGYGSTTLGVSAATLLVSLVSLVSMAPRRNVAVPVAERSVPVQSTVTEQAPARQASHHVNADDQLARQSVVRSSTPLRREVSQPNVAGEEELANARQLLEIARRKAEQIQREEARAHQQHSVAAANATAPLNSAQKVTQRPPRRPGAPQHNVRAGRHSDNGREHEELSNVSVQVSLASMGLVDNLPEELPNLDQALLRRRTAS